MQMTTRSERAFGSARRPARDEPVVVIRQADEDQLGSSPQAVAIGCHHRLLSSYGQLPETLEEI